MLSLHAIKEEVNYYYAVNVMGKDIDIFAIGAVSLNHIYTH
jgi:hypothetical protein